MAKLTRAERAASPQTLFSAAARAFPAERTLTGTFMLVLALDTASYHCSAALAENGQIIAAAEDNIGTGHAEHLARQLPALLAQAKKDFADIDRLGVNIGPGSFTGVRVGTAAARALALALEKPAFGFSAFSILQAEAQHEYKQASIFAVINSTQGQVFSQYFPAGGAAEKPQILTNAEAAAFITARLCRGKLCLTGSAAQDLSAQLPLSARAKLLPVPQTAANAPAAGITMLAALTAQATEANRPPVPLYMRAPDAKPQTEPYLSKAKSQFRAPAKAGKQAEHS